MSATLIEEGYEGVPDALTAAKRSLFAREQPIDMVIRRNMPPSGRHRAGCGIAGHRQYRNKPLLIFDPPNRTATRKIVRAARPAPAAGAKDLQQRALPRPMPGFSNEWHWKPRYRLGPP